MIVLLYTELVSYVTRLLNAAWRLVLLQAYSGQELPLFKIAYCLNKDEFSILPAEM